ncbi:MULTISPECIES: hypothetical protein [unclassified Clostridium]|uniref:hypothetical protein n=1 Tax=unclassified Clostridium TaxID=2614128 RepID=UPI00207AE825|nr:MULTISPECIES: hypothetical protein [unclassified Clostridium]
MNKEIKLFNISDRVHEKFKRSVKNNNNTSLEDCKKKLYRNFILGEEVLNDYNGQYIVRKYGKLYIEVDTKEWNVINIENRKSKNIKCFINDTEKQKLNQLLGLGGELNER